jgi:hypothetical protein
VEIDFERCRVAGRRISEHRDMITPDSFTDPRFYPPSGDDVEDVARYFLVMVAMDHRLSRPGRPYEAMLDDGFYHGADLLYRLGMEKYRSDKGFFDPARLAEISVEDVAEWLTPPGRPGLAPVDLELRAILLRDIGVKIQRLYGGSVSRLLEESGGRLKHMGQGFIERLKTMTAYSDPVEKKPYLLAKFLERRGLIKVRDEWNMEVPVDNHLTRIALRLGLVKPPSWMQAMLDSGESFSWEDDAMLRLAVRKAYKIVSAEARLSPFILDDFLWMFGRKCCVYVSSNTVCSARCGEECRRIGGCREDRCLFQDICVSAGLEHKPTEHLFLDTWYY